MAAEWKRYEAEFERATKLKANFDLARAEEFTKEHGWQIDEYTAELPDEPPGPPLERGSFALACEVLRNYEFPDPSILTGIFIPDHPLEGRIMLLRARFLFFRFLFPVRVSRVHDERREINGEPVHIWGFTYCTLEGHFEMGEITFEVWKYEASGKVAFRIHAYSQRTYIPNIFYRIGFRIFGRGIQIKFARTAMERMQQLVTARLRHVEADVETPTVQPASTDTQAREEVEELREEEKSKE